MNRFRTACLVTSVCLIMLFTVHSFTVSSAATESDAGSAMAQAQQRIETCYSLAADAAKAGANVTSLLETLDEAGWNLSQAQAAFQNGDFDSASALAVHSSHLLDGFEANASSLKDSASQAARVDFLVNVVGSTAGTFAVIVGGLLVWFILKRKPEKSRKVAQ